MKKKIIGMATKDIKKGKEIVIYLIDGRWKSNQLRIYKPGQRFFFRFVKRHFSNH